MRAEKPGAAGDEDPLLYRLHGVVLVVLGLAAGQPITRTGGGRRAGGGGFPHRQLPGGDAVIGEANRRISQA